MTPTNQVFILAKEPLIRTALRLLLATTDNFVLTGEAAFIHELSLTCMNDNPQILLYEIGGGAK